MNCPACQSPESSVTTTLKYNTMNIRKRICAHCKFVFQSVEMLSDMEAILVHAYKLSRSSIVRSPCGIEMLAIPGKADPS